MKGLHISVTCAALFVIVALVAYHLGGSGNCREGFDEGCHVMSDCDELGEGGVEACWMAHSDCPELETENECVAAKASASVLTNCRWHPPRH